MAPMTGGKIVNLVMASLLCIAGGGRPEPQEPIVRPVRYLQVFATGGARARTFSGISQAAVESRLSFKVAGTVTAVGVGVGDVVKKGHIIARLNPEDYQLQAQEAEAALRSAQAQSRNADSNYGRVRALYENRNASRNDLDASRATSESAKASVNAAQKRLEMATLQLEYATLRSPVDGSIATVNIEENENVSPGQTVALLTSGSQLEVRVAVPEILIAQIREGDAVSVRFDAIKKKSFSGVVTELGGSATGVASTFPAIVRLDHTDPDCRPGMAAEVEFQFHTPGKESRMLVPTASVGEDRQGRFVFVLDSEEDGFALARRTPVSVGDLVESGLEILEGIHEGDKVVTAGVSRITDGQKVKLLNRL